MHELEQSLNKEQAGLPVDLQLLKRAQHADKEIGVICANANLKKKNWFNQNLGYYVN